MPDSFDVSRLLFSSNCLPGVYYVIYQRWAEAFPTDKKDRLRVYWKKKMQLDFSFCGKQLVFQSGKAVAGNRLFSTIISQH